MTWWVWIQQDLKQFPANFARNDSLSVYFDPSLLEAAIPCREEPELMQ